MPTLSNPTGISKMESLKSAIKGVILVYAAKVLADETAITTGNPGNSAYKKRVLLARQVISNPDAWLEKFSVYVGVIDPTIETDNNCNYRYLLSDNPTSRNFCEVEVSPATWSNAGTTSGKQMWDVIAGVSQEDLTF